MVTKGRSPESATLHIWPADVHTWRSTLRACIDSVRWILEYQRYQRKPETLKMRLDNAYFRGQRETRKK